MSTHQSLAWSFGSGWMFIGSRRRYRAYSAKLCTIESRAPAGSEALPSPEREVSKESLQQYSNSARNTSF